MVETSIAELNEYLSPSVQTLGGKITDFDARNGEITMTFEAVDAFCHSGNIVQGGYITGMLDSAMTWSVRGNLGKEVAVPTLEIKVSFIAPGNPGELVAKARPVHLGRSTAFLSGELYQHDQLVATGTSTTKLFRPRPDAR